MTDNQVAEGPVQYGLFHPAEAADVTTSRITEDAIIAEARRILDARVDRGEPLTDPKKAEAFFVLRFAGLEREHFDAAWLDTRHRVIAMETLFMGDLAGCEVHPRVVAQRALAHNAAAVIFAHPHPSGVAEPSAADRAITQRLIQTLALVEVRVLDYLVVGGGKATSMANLGYV